MPDSGYIAVFLVGLLGGTHCAGMCGGIVAALGARQPAQGARWGIHLGYNLGRISTYTLLGCVLGAIGSAGLLFNELLPVQIGLYVAANLMLVALGLYLIGFTRVLAWPERLGHRLWQRLRPWVSRRGVQPASFGTAWPTGMLWGFLPCGMVYSVLGTALVSGSALNGAGLMLAFGLGTLPNLLLAGMLMLRFRQFMQARALRIVSGLLVLGFGLWGLWHSQSLGGELWQGVICTPEESTWHWIWQQIGHHSKH
ncbi:MAG: sulfite exporter TauE/SafE family protein [Moraxellaceae bacterium]|nr:sulfite exporter TauE/SafE family protein [Moraxellaceae bacterium]